MYYREDIIGGVLCCKTSPTGEYKQVSAKELTARLVGALKELSDVEEQLAEALAKLQ